MDNDIAAARRLVQLESELDRQITSKAQAILAGAGNYKAFIPEEDNLFSDYAQWRFGNDFEAGARVKAVLGTSAATGQAIIPNNVVADIVERVTAGNVWRQVLDVVPGIRGKGVDIPYEADAISNALVTSYGSNKQVQDFGTSTVTATLYTLAAIVDVGNQLLRQSQGAAEQLARSRLARSIAKAEQSLITTGTGTSQPRGIVQAFLDYGGTGFDTTLSSETRAAAIGRGIGALETRGATEGVAVVMSSTDYFEMATETLGSSGSGGWAFSPAEGAAGIRPAATLWGIPVYRDPLLTAGTAYVGAFKQCQLFTGQDLTIDVSSEANLRWDQNVTGFRVEEEIACDFRPYVFSGLIQRVTGV